MTELETQVQKHINKLPEATRRALSDFDWTTKLQELGQRHGLLVDEMGALEIETTLVLVGIEPAELYLTNVRKHLNISNTEAESLVRDINLTVFQPIHDLVLEYNKEAFEEHDELFEDKAKAEKPPKRDDILADIESINEPAPEKPKKTVAAAKLEDLFVQQPQATEHVVSTPKNAPEPVSQYTGNDPYLEPID